VRPFVKENAGNSPRNFRRNRGPSPGVTYPLAFKIAERPPISGFCAVTTSTVGV